MPSLQSIHNDAMSAVRKARAAREASPDDGPIRAVADAVFAVAKTLEDLADEVRDLDRKIASVKRRIS